MKSKRRRRSDSTSSIIVILHRGWRMCWWVKGGYCGGLCWKWWTNDGDEIGVKGEKYSHWSASADGGSVGSSRIGRGNRRSSADADSGGQRRPRAGNKGEMHPRRPRQSATAFPRTNYRRQLKRQID